MSKKMMKRTAALSAMIAVALSGTVMASELNIVYDNGEYKATGGVSAQGATVDALYTALSAADMAGEMKTYVTKKPSGIIAGLGLEGGTYTGGPVKAIGQFADEYNNNTLTVTGGSYIGVYRISGAATYEGAVTSDAKGNVVTIDNVTMQKSGSSYPGITGGWAWNDANGNTINITSSSLNDALIYGGDAQYGDANDNIINITDSTIGWINGGTTRYDGYDAMGNGKGNANGNKVTIKDSTVYKSFKGGSAGGYGNANNNIVDAEDLVFTGDAIEGGFAECGNAENNQVIIGGADTKISALVYGGRSQDKGSAIGNRVVINDGTFTNGSYGIAGGITENEGTFAQGTEGDALQNSVTINGGTIETKVHGGYSKKGSANENTVNITGGTFDKADKNIYGGYAAVDAVGNVVNVKDVTIAGAIRGGVAQTIANVTANAEGNKVSVENATIGKSVYGGVVEKDNATDGNAIKNEVTITDSTVGGEIHGGSIAAADSNSDENKVTLSNVTAQKWVSAGHSSYGGANNNELVIDGGSVASHVYGGRAQANGSASNNKVTATSAELNGPVFGGAAIDTYLEGWSTIDTAAADNNEVTLIDTTVTKDVYGGHNARNTDEYTDTANGNTVTITDGSVGGKVYGGHALKGEANDNTVNITSANIGDNIIGGWGLESASNNIVNVTDTTADAKVIGGSAHNSDNAKGYATDNQVFVTGSTVGANIVGGEVSVDTDVDGDANGNAVTITDSTVNGHIHGGSNSTDGAANENTVTLTNVTVGENSDTWVAAGHSSWGDANDNTLVIEGDQTVVNGLVFGGRAQANGSANNNSVTVTDATINRSVYGGRAIDTYYAGWSVADPAEANNNEVVLENATVNGDVYGGSAERNSDAYTNTANNNTVTITDGSVDGSVYGGFSKKGEASDNTVNIGGAANLANASLYGSNHADSTGNTLNLNDGWNGEVQSIQNFNTINISEATWGETAVTVTDTLAMNDTTVTVGTIHVSGSTTIEANDTSTLITAGNITGNTAEGTVSVYKGVASVYEASILQDGNDIIMQIPSDDVGQTTVSLNSQILSIGESRAAATALANQGSELIEIGLDALARDTNRATAEPTVFASVYGNKSTFSTGSHVKVNGWSAIVGAGKKLDNGLSYGAFFENGVGNYRTFNNVNGDILRGDGEATYNGGGFIVRKDDQNGLYTEASVRAGNLQNELESAVRGSQGLAGYDIDTFYYGAHIGVGKIIPKGQDSLDIYGKFIYAHYDSDNFTIDGDEFRFDSMDSQRLRLGLRYNKAQMNKVGLYYGAAWEYEFSGDAEYTVVGQDLSAPSLEGSTVIGEAGFRYNADARWNFDLNIRAYGGQREGFSGAVQVNYTF